MAKDKIPADKIPAGSYVVYGDSSSDVVNILFDALQKDEVISLHTPDSKVQSFTTKAIRQDWFMLAWEDDNFTYYFDSSNGWSRKQNAGTDYMKPNGGIPASDLDSSIIEQISDAKEFPETATDGDIMIFQSGRWVSSSMVSAMLAAGLYTPNLEADSWKTISAISASGNAANYYAIGDCKAVTLSGTMGTLALDMTSYVFILGFDHNAEIEGNGITFGGFKTLNDRAVVDICLTDSGYGNSTSDGSKLFNMNHWGGIDKSYKPISYNFGGWGGCDIRYDILGSTDVAPDNYGEMPAEGHHAGNDPTATCATNPVANTLMSCLPADLRAVMKPITKYTDNVGGGNGNVEENVTATVDYLPLCSEYEVTGKRNNANAYEKNYQAQYAYYAAGNSKVKYRHSDTSSTAAWWVRSVYSGISTVFCTIHHTGTAYNGVASLSFGVSPLVKV